MTAPLAMTTAKARRAVMTLKGILDVFAAHNIRAFIDYGTLLGAVRGGRVIPWDKDFDISVLREGDDFEERMKKAYQTFRVRSYHVRHKPVAKRKGLDLYEDGCALVRSFISTDVFIWHFDNKDKVWKRKRYAKCDARWYKGKEIHPDWVKDLVTLKLEGVDLAAPRDPVALVAHRYGDDWETPINHNDHKPMLERRFRNVTGSKAENKPVKREQTLPRPKKVAPKKAEKPVEKKAQDKPKVEKVIGENSESVKSVKKAPAKRQTPKKAEDKKDE